MRFGPPRGLQEEQRQPDHGLLEVPPPAARTPLARRGAVRGKEIMS